MSDAIIRWTLEYLGHAFAAMRQFFYSPSLSTTFVIQLCYIRCLTYYANLFKKKTLISKLEFVSVVRMHFLFIQIHLSKHEVTYRDTNIQSQCLVFVLFLVNRIFDRYISIYQARRK